MDAFVLFINRIERQTKRNAWQKKYNQSPKGKQIRKKAEKNQSVKRHLIKLRTFLHTVDENAEKNLALQPQPKIIFKTYPRFNLSQQQFIDRRFTHFMARIDFILVYIKS